MIETYINEEGRQMEVALNVSVEKVKEEKTVFVHEGHFAASKIEEELLVYRRMWASDGMTKEEYEQKKKQLLSLNEKTKLIGCCFCIVFCISGR